MKQEIIKTLQDKISKTDNPELKKALEVKLEALEGNKIVEK